MNQLIALFLGFARIGIMAFGGAYAAIPLVEREVVEINGWLTYEEYGNLLALDELTPGPILINSATFVGARVAGVPGAIAATLGTIAPACAISLTLLLIYKKYMKLDWLQSIIFAVKCMTVGLITVTILRAVTNSVLEPRSTLGFDPLMAIMTAAAIFVMKKWKPNPLWLMLGGGAINLIAALIKTI